MNTIVVGVDGMASLGALEWAIDEAKVRGAEIRAVHAWSYPVVGGTPNLVLPAHLDIDFVSEAQQTLDRVVSAASGTEDVVIHTEVVESGAAQALVRASADADLLVIGSRGLGGFRGLLLGSVGQQCAQHAACPVVIVPHGERPAA